MIPALVIVGTLVVLVVGAVVLGRAGHPEDAASHGADAPQASTEDRPAGPDAEAQHVVAPGEVAPG